MTLVIIVLVLRRLPLLVRVEVKKLHKVQRQDELTISLLEKVIEKESLHHAHVAVPVSPPHWLRWRPHVNNPSILVCVLVETFVPEGTFSFSLVEIFAVLLTQISSVISQQSPLLLF